MKTNTTGRGLSLDVPMTYQIKVSGQLEGDWSDWGEGTTSLATTDDDGPPESTITSTFDQAALHGLLRRLYSLGFPLISVNYVQHGAES
jgi:hypothetical protein